jgi:L-ascorbate metabolism protein UlaG (beta-lactamase superfamily)
LANEPLLLADMVLPGEDDPKRQVIERAKELDHEHRRQARTASESGILRVLSLRLLRTALRRLVSAPRRAIPRQVGSPAPGYIAVTFVGHASVMLTTNRARLLVDPYLGEFLAGIRRRESACLDEVDAQQASLILLSHAHRDRLHMASLRKLPRQAKLVVPPRCVSLVERLGFSDVIELAPGRAVEHGDVEITAVAARHDGRRGILDRAWRSTCGYIVKCGEASVYYAGDTAYFSGFAEIGRRLHPDVALLPIAGYQPPQQRSDHMSPLDAVHAFEDLGAKLLVPVGYGSFPMGYEPDDEPLAWLCELCRERSLTDRLVVLRPGETCQVHGRPRTTPGSP